MTQRDTPDPGEFFGALAPTRTLSNADTPDTEVRRLSFDMAAPHVVDAIQARYGKGCWPAWDWNDPDLGWSTVTVEFVGDERIGQYRTLKRWERTRKQPVRNVRLERWFVAGEWEPFDV